MKTIVIVEDEFHTREGLAHLIEKLDMGFKVLGCAEDGAEGLKMILDYRPDIVITDIQMPRTDGLKMIEQIRQAGLDCRIVLLSGYSEFEYAQKAIRLNVSEYLLKPVTISLVRELLSGLQEKQDSEIPETAETTGTEYSAPVAYMVTSIEKNYAQQLSLETFASELHMTAEYLSNLFTKEVGIGFSAFRRSVRLEKAKELLVSTDMKIYEVACAVGYPDQKYFSKAFKEYTGVSAKQYASGLK